MKHITMILLLLAAVIIACDDPEPVVPDIITSPAPTTAVIQSTAVQPTQAPVARVPSTSTPAARPAAPHTATPTPTVPPTARPAAPHTGTPTPAVPPTPTPVPIKEVNFTGIVTSTNQPSQMQVVFSLRDQEDHAIVLPAEQVERGLQVHERGPGTDGSWEEIDYTETSYFVHTAENIDLEVVFVLDFTNSMSAARLTDGSSGVQAMLRAFEASLAVLPSAHRIGVVEFHDRNVRPSVLSHLTTNRQAIWNSVSGFVSSGFDSGSSRVWDSVVTGSDLFSSREQNPRAVRALVFLSDGRDTSSDNTREQAAQYARERDVQFYVVGVGSVFEESELRSVAHSTGGAYYSAHDLDLVQEQLQLLVNDLKGQYQLTYITLRRSGEYHIGIAAELVGVHGSTEVGPFDVARFYGPDNQGVVGYDPPSLDRASQRATVFMRAQHIPRNIDRIRFRAHTNKPLQVELVPSRDGGLLEGWTLSGPDAGGWYEVASPTPLEFGSIGLLARLTFSNVTEDGLDIPIEFDNSVYTGGKTLAITLYLEIGNVTPYGSIAFASRREDPDDVRLLYVMDADGSNVDLLFSSDRSYSDPVWAPDGSRLVYSDQDNIWSSKPNGSVLGPLITGILLDHFGTKLPDGLYTSAAIDPDWSPDGSRIALAAIEEGSSSEYDIFVVKADGTAAIRLTDNNLRDRVPDWSPDGSRIVFTSRSSDTLETTEIYVMNADGSGVVRLTDNDHTDFDPVWSPDGREIVFYSNRDGYSEIYLMNLDGSNVRRLTRLLGHSRDPDWSPDGRWIVFSSSPLNDAGAYDIYIMRPDGSRLTRLTHNGADNVDASWTLSPSPFR